MQSSRFMVWGTEEKALDVIVNEGDYMEVPAQECGLRLYGEMQKKQFTFKVSVKALSKQSIIRQLEAVGISGKSIYPGIEGIGRYIERHYRFNYGEAF